MRRQGTVNLKGRKGGHAKRRSSTYGNTFASFDAPSPNQEPEANADIFNDELSTIDDEDDLLDGFVRIHTLSDTTHEQAMHIHATCSVVLL